MFRFLIFLLYIPIYFIKKSLKSIYYSFLLLVVFTVHDGMCLPKQFFSIHRDLYNISSVCITICFRSFLTSPIHLLHGLPCPLVPFIIARITPLGILLLSITWPSHLTLRDLMHFTMLLYSNICSISLFHILHILILLTIIY